MGHSAHHADNARRSVEAERQRLLMEGRAQFDENQAGPIAHRCGAHRREDWAAINANFGRKPSLSVPLVTAVAVDPTASRVFQLVTADRPLTAAEQAEVDAAERDAA